MDFGCNSRLCDTAYASAKAAPKRMRNKNYVNPHLNRQCRDARKEYVAQDFDTADPFANSNMQVNLHSYKWVHLRCQKSKKGGQAAKLHWKPPPVRGAQTAEALAFHDTVLESKTPTFHKSEPVVKKECIVCMEQFVPKQIAYQRCGHTLCKGCASKWQTVHSQQLTSDPRMISSKVPCPACRRPIFA